MMERLIDDVDDTTFKLWFPSKNGKVKTPRLRVICFHGAGSSELLWTNRGTPKRPYVNPLLEFCEMNEIEILAVNLPGRPGGKLRVLTSIQQGVETVGTLLSSHLRDGVPYVVIGHSMGSWFGFEFVRYVVGESQKEGGGKVTLPKHLVVACMPQPYVESPPWRNNKDLNDEEFKEECLCWDINKEVFDLWDVYEKVLRQDFTLFDTYDPLASSSSSTPFTLPCDVSGWFGEGDMRVGRKEIEEWSSLVSPPHTFQIYQVDDGNHLFLYQEKQRCQFLKAVNDNILDQILLDQEYGG